jgi:hypothetical protein
MLRAVFGNVKEWEDAFLNLCWRIGPTLFPSPFGEGCQAAFF